MISLTDKAVEKVREILNNDNKQDHALRIGVKGGGCSGFSYTLDIDKIIAESDQVFEEKGIKIVVDAKSFIYLSGTQVDYVENLSGSGFSFSNPNATRSCGCGSSFQA
ncbi:MAG: iron-sulfur cluster insertion protein ErpA [Calditrichia bacterium]|nr:iron-sulfur cluster insertion protein ErpA [Calditrichia bacterium]